MATVMENYRISVQAYCPKARLSVTRVEDGRTYQILNGNVPLCDPDCFPTSAWREAGFNVANARVPGCVTTLDSAEINVAWPNEAQVVMDAVT